MGTSHSWGELEHKLLRLANDYSDLPKTVVGEASLLAKKSVTAIAPARLRGVGKRGANLTVRYNTTGHGAEASSLVFARGPWQLIEDDTKAGVRRARGRKKFVVPGAQAGEGRGPRGVRLSINHPGTKGKHPWAKGIAAARPAIDRMFLAQATIPLRRIF